MCRGDKRERGILSLTLSGRQQQVHLTLFPNRSTFAFPIGHCIIYPFFFTQTEPGGGAYPLPNSNLPSAKSQSLLSHSLASKPAFGILKKEKNSGNLKSILATQKVFSCCANAVVICLFVYTVGETTRWRNDRLPSCDYYPSTSHFIYFSIYFTTQRTDQITAFRQLQNRAANHNARFFKILTH